jgi:hypothetical protein
MRKMKITKPQAAALRELLHFGGQVKASEWTNGSGRNITARTIPPFCERVERYKKHLYPKRIKSVFEHQPRVQAVVAVVNMRGAKAALKKFDEIQKAH